METVIGGFHGRPKTGAAPARTVPVESNFARPPHLAAANCSLRRPEPNWNETLS